MRLWLFVFAVLICLLALSNFGQADQPGWMADAQTGCRVWNARPQPNERVTWSGACQNGFAQGEGVEQWFQNGQPSIRYEGEFRHGKHNGHGVQTFADGSRYEGEFRDGTRNGYGIATFADGSRYQGEYKDGARNGRGVETLANGDRSEGEWRNGKFADTPISPQQGRLSYKSGQNSQNSSTTAVANGPQASAIIPLQNEGGVLVVPVTINNTLQLEFVLDSGAADVSIPADVVMTLVRSKTLTESDFIGQQVYRLADGSTVPSQTFRIRSLKVGDLEIQNVTGSVADVKGSLLLGQSFLRRLGKWSIDNQRQVLVIEGG